MPTRVLTVVEAQALAASSYPCPPDYRCPDGWALSAGGVPVPPVPEGAARRAAITAHYYHELTPQQRRDPHWDLDNTVTWDAFFSNRRERDLVRFEGDGPPPVNSNEAGRRLWWGGRRLVAVLRHIEAGDNPRLRYPHFNPAHRRPPPPKGDELLKLTPEWQAPREYAAIAAQFRRPEDPEEYPGQRAALRASLDPVPEKSGALWTKENPGCSHCGRPSVWPPLDTGGQGGSRRWHDDDLDDDFDDDYVTPRQEYD